MTDNASSAIPLVYWHRHLPPVSAEVMGEHIVEATSERVAGTMAHRDELWDRCYRDLMAKAGVRLEQEIRRLDGGYAHVLQEVVDTQHDDAKGEAWLRGRFTYVLYSRAVIPSGFPSPGTGSGSGRPSS